MYSYLEKRLYPGLEFETEFRFREEQEKGNKKEEEMENVGINE